MPRLRIVILFAFTVVASFMATFAAAEPKPVAGQGTWKMPDGTPVTFETEFWPEPCRMEKGAFEAPGLHEIRDAVYFESCMADTHEALRKAFTAASWAKYWSGEEPAKFLAAFKEMREAHPVEQLRRMRLPAWVFCSVKCRWNDEDYIFVAAMQGAPDGSVALETIKPPLLVWVVKFEQGKWRLEETFQDHPIAQRLSAGRFKEFGAPSDFVTAKPNPTTNPSPAPKRRE